MVFIAQAQLFPAAYLKLTGPKQLLVRYQIASGPKGVRCFGKWLKEDGANMSPSPIRREEKTDTHSNFGVVTILLLPLLLPMQPLGARHMPADQEKIRIAFLFFPTSYQWSIYRHEEWRSTEFGIYEYHVKTQNNSCPTQISSVFS